MIPAALIYKRDADNFLIGKIQKKCLNQKKNVSKEKPLLLKKRQEVEQMREIIATYKVCPPLPYGKCLDDLLSH